MLLGGGAAGAGTPRGPGGLVRAPEAVCGQPSRPASQLLRRPRAQNCWRITFRFRSWLNLFIRKSSLS